MGDRVHPIVCLPSFADAGECDALIASAERVSLRRQQSQVATERVVRLPVATLDREANRVCDAILHRVLELLEGSLKHVAIASFGQTSGLTSALHRRLDFSLDEPAVNVYYPGGEFRPHEDLKDLTVFVPLSPDGSFTGGGTAFWSEHIDVERGGDVQNFEPSLVLRLPRGTAAFWGGDITHAGQPVASGVRHIFVASFSLSRAEAAEAA